MPDKLKEQVLVRMRESYDFAKKHPRFEQVLTEFFNFLFQGFLAIWTRNFPDRQESDLITEILEAGAEGRHFCSSAGAFKIFLTES